MTERLTDADLRIVRQLSHKGYYHADVNHMIRLLADEVNESRNLLSGFTDDLRVNLLEHALKSANAECKRRGDALMKLTNETKEDER